MITVPKAVELIDTVSLQVSVKEVPISQAAGMVLREPLRSDRDLPPFDRVMMDGIAIRFDQWEKGQRSFPVEGLQKAGAPKQSLKDNQRCLEVMTGAILPGNTDTVIRYEDIEIQQQNGNSVAVIQQGPKQKRQNIHPKGTNRKKDDLVVQEGTVLSPAEIGVAATLGKSMLKVSAPPSVAVISTGDELVDIDQQPLPHQIRRSNAYTLAAALKESGVDADLFHLNDDRDDISEKLDQILGQNDLLILSGGVSKGKLDYIPELLEKKGIHKLFHKVRQRPGKPFWFGRSEQAVVFALPGNPVSSFSCYYRYVEPWLKKQLGIREVKRSFARLTEKFSFSKDLTYFLQVRIHASEDGTMEATPVKGKGSSDLANLCLGDGLLELPEERDNFEVGESFPLYLYRRV